MSNLITSPFYDLEIYFLIWRISLKLITFLLSSHVPADVNDFVSSQSTYFLLQLKVTSELLIYRSLEHLGPYLDATRQLKRIQPVE